MDICSGTKYIVHDNIVYEGRKCPLCLALEEINYLTDEISKLEE